MTRQPLGALKTWKKFEKISEAVVTAYFAVSDQKNCTTSVVACSEKRITLDQSVISKFKS